MYAGMKWHGSHGLKQSLSFSSTDGSGDSSWKPERGHTSHGITHTWKPKYGSELKQEHEEQPCGCRRAEDWESGIGRCKLLHIKV